MIEYGRWPTESALTYSALLDRVALQLPQSRPLHHERLCNLPRNIHGSAC